MQENNSYRPKKFAVIGAGPVGCIVAAFLSRGGYEVTLCDVQSSLLEAAMDPGINLSGTDNFLASVTKTTTRIDELADDPPDLLITVDSGISCHQGVARARESIDSGAAKKTLEDFIEFSQ